MKKRTKIAISIGVVGVTGISVFAILKHRKLARQAYAEIEADDENEMIVSEDDDTDDEVIDVDADSEEEQEAVEEAVDETETAEEAVDETEAEADELSSEEEQEAVEEAVDETETAEEAVLIYPPINECPYKSREVWAARIDECIGLLYNQIMMTTKKLNWEKIENELVDKYLKFSQDDFGVTGYEERYIRSKIMKINREQYENVIDTIDSVIDDIFNTNIDNKYIIDGHVNNEMICNDIMLKCCEEGVVREWQWPSVCVHLENNVNTTCEYINAVIAKNSLNN